MGIISGERKFAIQVMEKEMENMGYFGSEYRDNSWVVYGYDEKNGKYFMERGGLRFKAWKQEMGKRKMF